MMLIRSISVAALSVIGAVSCARAQEWKQVPSSFTNREGYTVTGYTVHLMFESLVTPSLDEEAAEYGLIAEAVSFPPDRSSVSYRLRAEARWHDGRPTTTGSVCR